MNKPTILKIGSFKQSRPAFCGPAALRIFLSFFGVIKSEKELATLCRTTEKRGTHPNNLLVALKKLGFKVKSGQGGNWKLLNFYINKKKLPVLIDWWKGDDDGEFMVYDGHYIVICGLNKDRVWFVDPNRVNKIVKMPWVPFERAWFDFEGERLERKKDLNLRWWLVARK